MKKGHENYTFYEVITDIFPSNCQVIAKFTLFTDEYANLPVITDIVKVITGIFHQTTEQLPYLPELLMDTPNHR